MKLKATFETEVYISNGGYLVINQKDPMGGDDSTVMLSPEQARLVAEEMRVLLDDPSWWNIKESDED